jgi:hypothetical protein
MCAVGHMITLIVGKPVRHDACCHHHSSRATCNHPNAVCLTISDVHYAELINANSTRVASLCVLVKASLGRLVDRFSESGRFTCSYVKPRAN